MRNGCPAASAPPQLDLAECLECASIEQLRQRIRLRLPFQFFGQAGSLAHPGLENIECIEQHLQFPGAVAPQSLGHPRLVGQRDDGFADLEQRPQHAKVHDRHQSGDQRDDDKREKRRDDQQHQPVSLLLDIGIDQCLEVVTTHVFERTQRLDITRMKSATVIVSRRARRPAWVRLSIRGKPSLANAPHASARRRAISADRSSRPDATRTP